MGATAGQVAAAYGVVGSADVAGSVAFILALSFSPRLAGALTASATRMLCVVCVMLVVSFLAALMMTALPDNYPAFVVARSLQGLAASIYFLQLLVVIVLAVPRQLQLRAIAFRNAGLSLGDSVAPFSGALLYEFAGKYVASASTAVVCIPALACAFGVTIASSRLHASSLQELPTAASGADAIEHEDSKSASDFSNSSSGLAPPLVAKDTAAGVAVMPQGQHLPQLATPTAVYGSGANDTEVAVNARAGANCGAADAKMIVDSGAASRQHRPSSFESSGPMFDTSEPAAVFSGRLLWQHLRDCFVLAESGIVLTSQALRQMTDLLLPLIMVKQRLWVVALLYASETVGAVTFPFVLDWALGRCHHPHDTHHTMLASVLVMAGVGASMLWLTDYLAAMFVLMLVLGAAHSAAEMLVCSQLAGHLRGSPEGSDAHAEETTAATYTGMCIFGIAFSLGYTVGAYLIGVVSHDDERGMRLLATCVSVVVAAYAVAVTGSVRVGWMKSREWACRNSRA